MKPILILAVIVLLMVLGGWLTFTKYGNRTSINLETQRIESDTQRALDRSHEIIDKTVRPSAPVAPQQPVADPVGSPIQ